MKKEMTIMGVGKKIAVPVVLYIVLTIFISYLSYPAFRITKSSGSTLITAGIIIGAIGFAINMIAALSMMKAFRNGKLVTGGLYRIFRDPMYIVQIFVTLPGVLLILNSWLALTTVVVAYISYKFFIKGEYEYLEEKFGDEYRDYKKKVLVKFL